LATPRGPSLNCSWIKNACCSSIHPNILFNEKYLDLKTEEQFMTRLGQRLFSGISMIAYVSQIFMVQSSWASASEDTYFAPTDPRTIVTLMNSAGTPANLIEALRMSVGPSAAKSVEKAFAQYGISMTEQIPKVTLQNGTILIADTQAPVLTIEGGNIAKLSTRNGQWQFDPQKNFEQNLQSSKKLISSKRVSTSSAFFGNFGIAEARADDPDGMQNAAALAQSQKQKTDHRWFVGASVATLVCLGIVMAPLTLPAALISVVGSLAIASVLAAGVAEAKLIHDTDYKPFSCPKEGSGNLTLTLGGLTLIADLNKGSQKTIDVYAGGKVTSTYFVGNDWNVLGLQDAGKSAEVPLRRKLSDQEKVLVGGMKDLAAACADPKHLAQLQNQVDQVRAELRGTAGTPNTPHNGSAGNPS
jgi:hypothetical protein